MAEIKCPKCGTIIPITEEEYSSILLQVKNEEFKKEVEDKVKIESSLISKNYENEIKNKELENKNEIDRLKIEIESLKSKQKNIEDEKNNAIKMAVSEKSNEYENKIRLLTDKISKLEFACDNASKDKESEIYKINAENQQMILQLKSEIEIQKSNAEIEKNSLKEQYLSENKMLKEEIERYKDFKAKQSTKMIGESLEQYCQNEFNKNRVISYPYAYFEKDNEVSKLSSSKGDFIFKDYEDENREVELFSIMFEMKNEADTTATKHKNEDFFKELDKDRNEKNCEYAVLVTMLEADNDFYNAGIVDVSYRYPKMFVVRPQCFLSIIALIKNISKQSLSYKYQLENLKKENIDVTNFEEKLNKFKTDFEYNFSQASSRFSTAIEEIDKTIDHLTKVRENLLKSNNQLSKANDKVQDITIRRLTKDNPTMKAKFENK